MPSASREAAFRASHGMSSGAWYKMRRKAAAAGIAPKDFDKARGRPSTYKAIKQVVAAKRTVAKKQSKGKDAQKVIQGYIDLLPPDIEVIWGTP